jgi:NAD(P)H dehydrogenase (quinone)
VRSRPKVVDFVARGLQVREADYSEPNSMRAALTGVNRLLLVSSSDAG